MNPEEIRKQCAYEAMSCIKSGDIVGLGGGRTVACLIELLKKMDIKIVTPSTKTRTLCQKYGLSVVSLNQVDHINVAFDGCDEVDASFNALKSGGGIHTIEKLIATMAEDYILLVDESKFVPTLSFKHPISLEILKESQSYVIKKVRELDGRPEIRTSSNKDGYTITDHGNILLDVYFDKVNDIDLLNNQLKSIAGVVETSLFTNIISKVIVAGEASIKRFEKTLR